MRVLSSLEEELLYAVQQAARLLELTAAFEDNPDFKKCLQEESAKLRTLVAKVKDYPNDNPDRS